MPDPKPKSETEIQAEILDAAMYGGNGLGGSNYPVSSNARQTPTGRYASGKTPRAPRMPTSSNPLITFTVTTSTIRPTLNSLTVELTGSAVAAQAALIASAKRIQARAKSNVRRYRYEGRLEEAIEVHVSKKSTRNMVRVTVGIHGRTFAPEGATFEKGWRSEKGLMPPSEPLAFWAMRRGLAKDQKEADRLGYVIARSMGRRGYSFGTRPWLSTAFAAEAASVEPTVARYILSSWGARGRDAGGRFLASG